MAARQGVPLGVPVFLPAGLGPLAAFGSLRSLLGPAPSRSAAAAIALAGPLTGLAASCSVLLVGLHFTMQGWGGLNMTLDAFDEAGPLGAVVHAVLDHGDAAAATLDCHPWLVAGAGGVLINALALVPAGDTDGGRLATHILGREAAMRLSLLSLALLGALGWVNQLADWWLPALLILHGSPPALCTDEVTPVSKDLKLAGLLCLCLPAAMLVPRFGGS
ncbi:hypothetical protein F751_6139 [Auxenochlorella protothecoides]|nr:hypothetical protein F751_6139 [Auxenochlorella protothecoides]KFM25184.1 hypothetical protein F751_6139 [Auxenochlorella protothecoides]